MGDRPSTSTAHVPSSSPPSPQSSGSSSPAADADDSHPPTASYLSGIWAGLLRHLSLDEDEAEAEPPAMDDVSLRQTPARDNLGPREQALGNGVDAVFHPASRRGSPFRPPPLEPLLLLGFDNTTPASARLLTAAVAEEVRTMVPERLRIADEWHLVYSLEQDGASLGTLYQNCRHYEGRRVGFVLVVRDQEGGVSVERKQKRNDIMTLVWADPKVRFIFSCHLFLNPKDFRWLSFGITAAIPVLPR